MEYLDLTSFFMICTYLREEDIISFSLVSKKIREIFGKGERLAKNFLKDREIDITELSLDDVCERYVHCDDWFHVFLKIKYGNRLHKNHHDIFCLKEGKIYYIDHTCFLLNISSGERIIFNDKRNPIKSIFEKSSSVSNSYASVLGVKTFRGDKYDLTFPNDSSYEESNANLVPVQKPYLEYEKYRKIGFCLVSEEVFSKVHFTKLYHYSDSSSIGLLSNGCIGSMNKHMFSPYGSGGYLNHSLQYDGELISWEIFPEKIVKAAITQINYEILCVLENGKIAFKNKYSVVRVSEDFMINPENVKSIRIVENGSGGFISMKTGEIIRTSHKSTAITLEYIKIDFENKFDYFDYCFLGNVICINREGEVFISNKRKLCKACEICKILASSNIKAFKIINTLKVIDNCVSIAYIDKQDKLKICL